MQQLTEEGRRTVREVAQRYGFSDDAVTEMLTAVATGHGNQAQFNHPEFGGMGQWSSGGMLMIGDMFNSSLKGRVGALCEELSGLVSRQPLFARPVQSQTQSQGGGWQNQVPGYGQLSQGGVTGSSLFVCGLGVERLVAPRPGNGRFGRRAKQYPVCVFPRRAALGDRRQRASDVLRYRRAPDPRGFRSSKVATNLYCSPASLGLCALPISRWSPRWI